MLAENIRAMIGLARCERPSWLSRAFHLGKRHDPTPDATSAALAVIRRLRAEQTIALKLL
jgi:hypothetical protein